MANKATAVGYFSSQAEAESAINALKRAGFQQNQIGVAVQSAQSGTTGNNPAYKAGHAAGGAWESVKNFFSGNTAEPYAGESSKETFNDRVVTSDDYGSDDVHQSLSGLSVPPEHARYFGHQLGKSNEGAVVTVTAQGREAEAIEILKKTARISEMMPQNLTMGLQRRSRQVLRTFSFLAKSCASTRTV